MAVPFTTALGIKLRNITIRRYSNRGAERYETHRHGRRWAAENRAFEHFYRKANPKKVLDCPVGTGRWFDAYRANSASVLGLDISENMLGEAAEKTDGADIRLVRADILDPQNAPDIGRGYDLIVCTRFVYWLRPPELAIMLERFHATGAPFLIASAKVAIESRSHAAARPRGVLKALDRWRAHLYRAVVKRVYREDALLRIFTECGWRLAEKKEVITTHSVRYLYYLFERTEAAKTVHRGRSA